MHLQGLERPHLIPMRVAAGCLPPGSVLGSGFDPAALWGRAHVLLFPVPPPPPPPCSPQSSWHLQPRVARQLCHGARVCYTRGLRACTSHVRYMHDALSTCVYTRTISVHTWCYVRCVRCACVVCYGYDVRAVPVRRVACVVQYVVCTTHI